MDIIKTIFTLCILLAFHVCVNSQVYKEHNSSIESKSSLFNKDFYIGDGEKYELDLNFMYTSKERNASLYKVDFENMYPSTPIVIKSFEDDISTFSVLRSYAIDNLPEPYSFYGNGGSFYSTNKYLIYKTNPFPGYEIDRNGGGPDYDAFKEKIIQAWTYGSNYLLPFFHRIMKSASARKEVYQYISQTFQNVSEIIPVSVKKKIIDVCKKLQSFLTAYKIDRQKYVNLSQKDDFIYEIGIFEAFLFRRLETDKVPINELSGFITSFQALVEKELKSRSTDYYFRININDSDIIICDGISSNYSIYSKQSINRIDMNDLSSIRCIKSDSNNYLIKYDGKETFYNNKLEVIKRD